MRPRWWPTSSTPSSPRSPDFVEQYPEFTQEVVTALVSSLADLKTATDPAVVLQGMPADFQSAVKDSWSKQWELAKSGFTRATGGFSETRSPRPRRPRQILGAGGRRLHRAAGAVRQQVRHRRLRGTENSRPQRSELTRWRTGPPLVTRPATHRRAVANCSPITIGLAIFRRRPSTNHPLHCRTSGDEDARRRTPAPHRRTANSRRSPRPAPRSTRSKCGG